VPPQETPFETEIVPYGPDGIARAAALILEGLPVAMPTETVYGLAADATNEEAVARVYAAKGRPGFNPLIVHVRDRDHAESLGVWFPEAARDLARLHWPGPLTIVLPVNPFTNIARNVTAGLDTIALRAPAHAALRDLLDATGRPLAAPSANASGAISPTTAEHVLLSLNGRIPMVVDAGASELGLESTIIKIRDDVLTVLRAGPIDPDSIGGYALLKHSAKWTEKIEAPGQLARHYAPSKPLRLEAEDARADEWLIGFGPVAGEDSLSPSGDLAEAAASLFAALHRADLSPRARIAVAPVPQEGIGRAINDRLARAAARWEEG
jgi:L-threonylcarbamoyladenylate synthase